AAIAGRSGFAMARKSDGPMLLGFGEPEAVAAQVAVERAIGAVIMNPPLPVVHRIQMPPIEPATDPNERLLVLAAAVRRGISLLYSERRPEARAALEIGLQDAGFSLDESA